MNRRIFLDMDGPLVDFVSGALKIHGWTQEKLYRAMEPGEYDLARPMGLTEDEFWTPIHAAGERFWLELEPLPWAKKVIELVERLAFIGSASGNDNWWIVTAPTQDASSYSGKMKWLQWFRGIDCNSRVIFTADKHLLAQRRTLLIDDRQETVDKFLKAGGDAVIFPTRHNKLYYYADDPVTYLSELLEDAKCIS